MPTTSPICRAETGLAVSAYRASSVATTSPTRVSPNGLKRITFGSRFAPLGTRIGQLRVVQIFGAIDVAKRGRRHRHDDGQGGGQPPSQTAIGRMTDSHQIESMKGRIDGDE